MEKALIQIAKELKLIRVILEKYTKNEKEYVEWLKGNDPEHNIADEQIKDYII